MDGGYVLGYSNRTFADLFASYEIDIYSEKFERGTGSKAQRLRAFWDTQPDDIVGKILYELLSTWELDNLNSTESDKLFPKAREIVARLSNETPNASAESFLKRSFEIPPLDKLPVPPNVAKIIEDRIAEIESCISVGAHTAAVVLAGSVLEGALLGAALGNPQKFNQSSAAPTSRDGKVKAFQDWKLGEFIAVAHDVEMVRLDVKAYSQSLRDFRNFIHPFQQVATGFHMDHHTAEISVQVLRAALADITGAR